MHRRNFMRTPRFLLGMGVEIRGWIVTDYRKKYCLYFQQSPFQLIASDMEIYTLGN